MAAAHMYFNQELRPYGAMLRLMLLRSEEADDLMTDVRDVMIQMRDGADDGDEGNHANYAEITARFGFVSDAQARAAFLEIDSAYSKTSGDGAVDHVRAARDNLFAKLR